MNEKGAKLSVVSCRKSDADPLTVIAHQRAFKNLKGHNVTRIEKRIGQPRCDEAYVLVDEEGKCFLKGLSREWDPHSFGNAQNLKGLYLEVQKAAFGGQGSNLLHCPKVDVIECMNELLEKHPLLEQTFYETATPGDWDKVAKNMPCWDTKLAGANKAGANYVLIYSNALVTVKNLLKELRKKEYNCVGMNAIRQSLVQRKVEGGGGDIVKAVNSGETTKGGQSASMRTRVRFQ